MTGEEPVLGHVFTTEPYRRLLLQRWRWQCSCGVTKDGYVTKTAAIFAGDTHAMRSE